MKMIYIANARIPTEKAHGWQIMKMCEAFAVSCIDLQLILPARINTRELSKVDPFDYYHIGKNFSLKKIKTIDPIFLLHWPAGFYIKMQSFFFIISLFLFLIFLKNKKDFVFYTRDEQLLPLILLFSNKVIWEAHNLPSNKQCYLKYWRKCNKIITITNGLKNDLIKLGLSSNQILVAPDAVDFDQFLSVEKTKYELRQKLGLPHDKNIVAYTGHLYPWKGVQILAEASSFLSDKELVMIIGGTDRDIADFKEKNKDKNNLLVVGRILQNQVPMYLKAADVLILPNSAKQTISQSYTSPLKLFEYMASGQSIVASDLPSIREVLNDHNAILVEPDNPLKLAEGIKSVLHNDNLRDRISKQSLIDVQKYTWKKRARDINNFFLQ